MRRLALLAALLAGHAAAAQQAPADTSDVYEVPPEIVGGLAALQDNIAYPSADRRAGRQGTVIVRFVVTASGKPAAVEVARGVSPGLDSAAVAGVRALRFVPGRQGGQAVDVRMSVPVRFSITGEPAPYQAQTGFNTNSRWTDDFAARADSGEVRDGRGRLVWLDVSETVERAVAVVEDSVVTEVIMTLTPQTDMSAYSEIPGDLVGLQPRADGFHHAVDLVARGLVYKTDVAVDLARRTIHTRRPQCATSPAAADCVSVFPMLVGGVEGVAERVRMSGAAGRLREDVRVVVAMDVDGIGAVFRPAIVTSSARGRDGRALERAVLAALAEAKFVIDPTRDSPVPARVVLSFTFSGAD
ncbi:MAG TPA: TonB family protein [Rubricoccaceae bacterium]|jgi:TonB family protein